MLDWLQVQSSVISAVAYQGSSLFIRFVSGHEYEYYNVPERIYEGLIKAASKGQYFNTHIKDRYRYDRIF